VVYLTGNFALGRVRTLKKNLMLNWIFTAVLLMALWFIMSEKTEPKFLIIGAVSSIAIATLSLRLQIMPGTKSGEPYYIGGVNPVRFIAYFFWLIVQIAKSAFYVSIVSTISMNELNPAVVWFRADYDNPAARATLANSITLTPGTITIEINNDGIYSVHCLTDYVRNGLLDGSMQRKVAWLYGEEINFEVVDTYIDSSEQSSPVRYARLKNVRFRRDSK
jgi:multicomponent Na+:H+ antiporter subunit E